ncbi:hypothetical protein OHW15_16970 [Acinetobacter baumannii]|uniref:hypothetical protein n=1 Tax=Acinetobacter baumannii TaxID=470 RepID=UPI00233E9A88|nr:hypothetical protein [Acinetobacter baumannii]MDC4524101.1 hypothetical protein [Acinetobacter baumannii]MDC4987633.1 hypothetical protein [Acinetobacter baumannii]MDC5002018.1 hypothetical protein [Acinetobacter baumannii]MDC5127301.1 hypothetical protein [Acinetobacter baumannii]
MKKNKLLLITLMVGIIALSIAFFIKSQSVTATKRLGDGDDTNQREKTTSEPAIQNSISSSELPHKNIASSTKVQNDDLLIFNSDLKALREKYPDGVIYTKLSESKLNKAQRDALAKEFDNLNRYGSFSGGKITNEFSNLDKKRAALKEEKPLDFKPTNTDSLVPDLKLSGKWYSGAINEGKYNSLYRLYENQDGSTKFEITEMYLNPNNSAIVEVFQESLNHNVNNVPMTIETLRTENGKDIYNVHFNYNDRYYSLSTENMTRAQVENILNQITK